tara:strand:- start:224 stop:775 length:552 start_codon:yes stop_codon:yes gene_type:complete
MDKQKFLLGFIVLTVLNVLALQQWKINQLSNHLDISDMRAKVNTEFADELLWLQINDVEQLTQDSLIAQGKLQAMVDYYAQDEGTRNQIDNLWHEGYMRGLGQTEWEYDVLSESNYNKGYKDALDKAFPDGDFPQYVNYPPREVNDSAIKTPEFDDKLESLKDNTEVIDQLNDKIKEVKAEGN